MSTLVVRGNTHRCAYYPGYYVKSEVTLLCTDSPSVRSNGLHPYSCTALSNLFIPPNADAGGSQQSSPLSASVANKSPDPRSGRGSPLGTWFMGNWLSGVEDSASETPTVDKSIDIVSVFAQAYGVCIGDAAWLNQLQPAPGPATEVQGCTATHGPKAGNHAYVFQSQTQQLLSSMNIPAAQHRKFCFRFRLPPALPPSFRGNAIRYSYYVWLCIIWKTANSSPKQFVVKLPFRVWSPLFSLSPRNPPYVAEGFNYDWSVAELPSEPQRADDPSADQLVYFSSMPSLAANTEQRKAFQKQQHTPSNILATNMASAITESMTSIANVQLNDMSVPIPRRRPDPYEYIFQTIQHHLATKNSLKEFLIQNQGKSIALGQVPFLKYLSSATHYCIGDTVQGVLQPVPNDLFVCVKVLVRLECEEKVPVGLFKPGTIVATKDIGAESPFTVPTRIVNRVVVGEAEEFVLDCDSTAFVLMIPPSQSATFYTDKVTCEWVLRFEFHYATQANAYGTTPDRPIQCEEVIRWHQALHVFVPPQACKNEKPGKVVHAVAQ